MKMGNLFFITAFFIFYLLSAINGDESLPKAVDLPSKESNDSKAENLEVPDELAEVAVDEQAAISVLPDVNQSDMEYVSWQDEQSLNASESQPDDTEADRNGNDNYNHSSVLIFSSSTNPGFSLVKHNRTVREAYGYVDADADADADAGTDADVDAGADIEAKVAPDVESGADVAAKVAADVGVGADVAAKVAADVGVGADVTAKVAADVETDVGAGADIAAKVAADVETDVGAGADVAAKVADDAGTDAGADAGVDAGTGTGTCQVPKKRKSSTLMCVAYPRHVECKQLCIFGHTLSDGIQRSYKCVHAENQWIPDIDNEECLPFVDCNVRIVGSGRYTCYPGKVGNGPVCRIACNHYEDKPPTEEASYQCDINGKWSPDLPHCVKAGSGISLVPAPSGIKYSV